MNEDDAPSYPPPPPPAPGMGCYTRGCLTLVAAVLLIGLVGGGILWYVATNLTPFLSPDPVAIRIFPATDEQYQAVRAKVDPFLDAARAGQATSVSLSADEINTLIARDPMFDGARGKVYVAINNNQLSTDVSLRVSEEMGAMPSQVVYFDARAGYDASYAGGDFTMVLRRVDLLDGKPTPGLVTWLLDSRGFVYGLTRMTNDKFHASLHKYPVQAEILSHLRQAIVKDNQVVLTSKGAP